MLPPISEIITFLAFTAVLYFIHRQTKVVEVKYIMFIYVGLSIALWTLNLLGI